MLKIIGYFLFVAGIFGMVFCFYNAIVCLSDRYYYRNLNELTLCAIFFVISSLIVFYCCQYIISSKKDKELKIIEQENLLLQKKIELKKLTAPQ